MSSKVAIIVLCLLIVLFCIGTGMGLLQDDAPTSISSNQNGKLTTPGWLKGIGSLLPKEKMKADAILRATPLNCLQTNPDRIVIASGMGCQLRIGSSSRSRTLIWRLSSGSETKLALKQPVNADGDIVTAKYTIGNQEQVTLDFYRRQRENDSITVEIECPTIGSQDCVLEWAE